MITPTQTTYTNRLIHEKSPYLLQHAHNPVDWYPWGDEAFVKAEAEDKPVFLSIGYSTCHWCHVMERESFEDKEVADLLNGGFVSIKVDREERPDVDAFYMDACMALNGSGGWPLSCFLMPDRKPFFAGTYFPKKDGPYGVGFLSVLRQVGEAWQNRRKEAADFAETIVSHISREEEKSALEPDREDAAFRRLEERFDPEYGGFGGPPKFPSLPILAFLMRYGLVHQESRAFDMVRTTLDGMARGGIHDAVGGGFCRYSTDQRWLVPHFEKMMTDNALHVLAYSEAAALFGKSYAETARETVRFCIRDMLDEAGGFYTAMDADSEGEEGKFYVFSPEEIIGVLGNEDGHRFCETYHITEEGNFAGKSIPNRIGNTAEEDAGWLRQCTEKVLAFREKRVPPARDDKVLSLVNGLMTAALAVEGRILGDGQAVEAARRCARFLLSELVQDGRLLSRWREGEAGIPASSDDYACLIWGFLELYETTFEPEWLEQAVLFTERMNALFLDVSEGGYFLSGSDVKGLPARQKIFYDGAVPSGNSVMAMNLLRLARLCAKPEYEREAIRIRNLAASILNNSPDACCGLLCSLLYLRGGGTEVILADGDGFGSLREAIPPFSPFLTAAACGKNYQGIAAAAPYLKDYPNAEGTACAYVCRNGSCMKPVTSAQSLSQLLAAQREAVPENPGIL